MKAWLRQHRFALLDAFGRLRRHPGSFVFNIGTVAIALALPLFGLTVLENLRGDSRQFAVEPEMSLFMALDTPRARALALAPAIQRVLQENHSEAGITFIPRENALNMLKDRTGSAVALATLGSNPLPDAYVLKLAGLEQAASVSRVETIAAQMKALPGVEFVQIDSAWVKRLAALLQILQVVLLVVATALGLAVVAVVFNTVRLQVLSQKEEIEVSRLVGATDAFIYRPFYYSGALLGLSAGGVALGAVALSLQPLNAAIGEFARLYASEFRLAPVTWSIWLPLLGLSATLGMTGAMLSVRQHLTRAK